MSNYPQGQQRSSYYPQIAFAIIALMLAACSSGLTPAPYTPPPVVAPVIAPRPGTQIMVADWTPPLHIALKCGGPGLASPFKCELPPDAKWGVAPLDYGLNPCIDPEPNTCFQPQAGWLGFTFPNSGMSLIGAITLDRTKPMSVREEVRVDSINCNTGVGYVGPVLYGGGVDDGDPTGRYRALYISCFAGDQKVRLWLYSPTYAAPIWDYDFRDGQTHALRIDWYPGDHVDYFLDDALVFTEAKSFGHDPLDVPHDPHPALWFGSVSGAVGQFDVYGG